MSVQSTNNSLNGFRTLKYSPLERFMSQQSNAVAQGKEAAELVKDDGSISKKLLKGNGLETSTSSGASTTSESESEGYGYGQDYSEAGNGSIFDTGVQEDTTPEYISNDDLGEPTDVASDERLKDVEETFESFNLIDAIANLNAYDFTYKPEAQEMTDPTESIDNDEHVGVMAQELKENPVTESVVKDIGGYLAIDTKELTTLNTAVISAICKKLQEIESRIAKQGE